MQTRRETTYTLDFCSGNDLRASKMLCRGSPRFQPASQPRLGPSGDHHSVLTVCALWAHTVAAAGRDRAPRSHSGACALHFRETHTNAHLRLGQRKDAQRRTTCRELAGGIGCYDSQGRMALAIVLAVVR